MLFKKSSRSNSEAKTLSYFIIHVLLLKGGFSSRFNSSLTTTKTYNMNEMNKNRECLFLFLVIWRWHESDLLMDTDINTYYIFKCNT